MSTLLSVISKIGIVIIGIVVLYNAAYLLGAIVGFLKGIFS